MVFKTLYLRQSAQPNEKRRELFLFGCSYYLMQGSSFTTFNTQVMVLIAQPFFV
jgi:hypothetical protein